jgi:hypothetical protein
MSSDGDGGETLELQAFKIAENAIKYKGSHPCPACGVVMNPVEFLYGKGICQECLEARAVRRVKGRLA